MYLCHFWPLIAIYVGTVIKKVVLFLDEANAVLKG